MEEVEKEEDEAAKISRLNEGIYNVWCVCVVR